VTEQPLVPFCKRQRTQARSRQAEIVVWRSGRPGIPSERQLDAADFLKVALADAIQGRLKQNDHEDFVRNSIDWQNCTSGTEFNVIGSIIASAWNASPNRELSSRLLGSTAGKCSLRSALVAFIYLERYAPSPAAAAPVANHGDGLPPLAPTLARWSKENFMVEVNLPRHILDRAEKRWAQKLEAQTRVWKLAERSQRRVTDQGVPVVRRRERRKLAKEIA
jgi:hypothetical protein